MLLTVHVQPNAKKSEIVAWLDSDTLKVRVAAPATEGRANVELVRFFAKHFSVPQSCVEIIRGRTTRLKHVRVDK